MLVMRSMYFRQQALVAEQALDKFEAFFNYTEAECGDQLPESNSIEFKEVVFSYSEAAEPAVNGVSFKIAEGETVAIVGASGSGKTTVARLAARFWDCSSGKVLIGGVNVRDIPKKALMDKISFVFQNTKLFKGTLRDNIVFGSSNVLEEDISRAVKFSCSKEILESLPNGLETIIGPGGTYLSGGECQRIALARAMVKNAPIVLLDEATAFADPENEYLIREAIKKLCLGKTTLMIAHRLSSVIGVDKIIVMAAGKIAESGKHEELLARNGLYKKMWDEYRSSVEWKIES